MTTKEKVWLKALIEITNIFKKFKIQYFLDTGTLLGAIRGNRFIPWDNDIDLGVYSSNFPNEKLLIELSNIFYRLGYNVTADKKNISIKKSKTDIEINIKFYENESINSVGEFVIVNGNKFCALMYNHLKGNIIYKKGYGLFYYVTAIYSRFLKNTGFMVPYRLEKYILKKANFSFKKTLIPSFLINNTIDYVFYNEPFSIPKNYKKYLVHRYGLKWNVVLRDYNYLTDDQSILKE